MYAVAVSAVGTISVQYFSAPPPHSLIRLVPITPTPQDSVILIRFRTPRHWAMSRMSVPPLTMPDSEEPSTTDLTVMLSCLQFRHASKPPDTFLPSKPIHGISSDQCALSADEIILYLHLNVCYMFRPSSGNTRDVEGTLF